MRAALEELRQAALAEIAACRTDPDLEAVRVRYLGRKGSLTGVLRGLRDVPVDERPAVGALVNDVKDAVEKALKMIEPTLTLVLGGMLALILFSVLSPIYEMIGNLKI